MSLAKENMAGNQPTSIVSCKICVILNQKPIITRKKISPSGCPRPLDVQGAKSEKMVASFDRLTFISISVCFDTCGTTGKFTVKSLLPPNQPQGVSPRLTGATLTKLSGRPELAHRKKVTKCQQINIKLKNPFLHIGNTSERI